MKTIVEPGVFFSIPLSTTSFGFGHVVARQDPVFLMVAYDLRSDTSDVSAQTLQSSNVILIGNFFDVLIRNGRWRILGHSNPPPVVFPCFKVRIGDGFYVESWYRERKREATAAEVSRLPFRANIGPIVLENALKAFFGLGPREPLFDALKTENVATSQIWDVH